MALSPKSQPYMAKIRQEAAKYGLNPMTLAAQLQQESGWNPNAKSHAGATGLAQFMPATAKQYGLNALDPMQSIEAQAKYMGRLKNMFGGDERKALTAYNWGEGNLQAYLKTGRGMKGQAMPAEAANYASAVYRHIGGPQTGASAQAQGGMFDTVPPQQQRDNGIMGAFDAPTMVATRPDGTQQGIVAENEEERQGLWDLQNNLPKEEQERNANIISALVPSVNKVTQPQLFKSRNQDMIDSYIDTIINSSETDIG